MARTHRKNKALIQKMNSFRERFTKRFDEANPKPRPLAPRPKRPDLPAWPDRKDYYYTRMIGSFEHTDFDSYNWRRDTSAIMRERNKIMREHEDEVARWERRWSKVIEAHSARRTKYWDEWFRSPECAERDKFWEDMPRLRHPYTNHEVSIADSHLYGYGARPEGARRGVLTPNLAREYMRTHEAMQEYENGAKDPICLDCGGTLNENESIFCYGCMRRCEHEAWDDPYEQPDDWSWAWEEASDMDTSEILEVMSGAIAFMPRTDEDADLLLT